MTQENINHLFENYTDLKKIYWTADGTAFKSLNDAEQYAFKLKNREIKVLGHGGKLKDAKVLNAEVDIVVEQVEAKSK